MKVFGRRTMSPTKAVAPLARPASPTLAASESDRPSAANTVQPALDHKLIGSAAERAHDVILEVLTQGGGVHVETLMTALGAVAGFAAQNAAWRSRETAASLSIAKTDSGELFYFGNIVNAYLVPEAHPYGPPQNMALQVYLTTACTNAGALIVDTDEIVALFMHTSQSIGSETFGVPRLPMQHMPHLQPRRALEIFWPVVSKVLSAPLADGRRMPAELWPVGIGLASAVLIERTKDALSPTMSMRIVLEAAVPMSKVDPATVPGARGTA